MSDPRAPSSLATFSRGTILWWQQAKLLTSAIVAVLVSSIVVGVLAGGAYLYLITSAQTRYLAIKHVEAEFLTIVPMANPNVSFHFGDDVTNLPPDAALSFTEEAADEFFVYARNAALYAVLTTIGVFIFAVIFWMEYGRGRLTDKQIRGARLVNAEELTKELREQGDASRYLIAGVPMRKKAENLNTLIAGAQGTGKSQQFFAMMDQVRAQGKRAIVYDTSGEFTATYFREGKDIILNPFDARSPNWNVWREIQEDYHNDGIAEGLIPIPPNVPDPFFAIAGRMIVKDTIRALGEDGKRTNAALYKTIAHSNLEELHAVLIKQAAGTYVDPVTERTGMSLKMTVQNQLDSFRYLHDEGEPFSIRQWIQDEDPKNDSWLFISCNEEQKLAILPLISLWCDIAIRSLLTLEPSHSERMWYFYDELPTLQKLEIMKLAATNIRKFGGCFVIGLQDFSQLFQIYGEHLARTIISGCQTKLLLRVTDGDAAKALANAIGQADLDEKEESVNLGIDERRDGMSVFARRNLRDLVLSSEILRLPDMQGYVVTPGPYPIARVKYGYVPHAKVASPYIPRKSFALWLPPGNGAAAAPGTDAAPASALTAPATASAQQVSTPAAAAATQSEPTAPTPPTALVQAPASSASQGAPKPAAASSAPTPSPTPGDAATSSPSVVRSGSDSSNLVVLPSGVVVDGDTGEVQGEASRLDTQSNRGQSGSLGFDDLMR
ncbi:type IV secretion system DNA-binding domain-containing protein [Burkholderia gladioli]|uniref:type IV secretion system DNA-binding domain-containing protein n=1 Tax=Burkholderia gladioli TaxID=28095 RepID=UPI000CFF3F0E|nr:type IV secretion system DNA-binding domain-containing protein [Burkholderia gladioli]MBU9276843.1 type IV secretion system DNA-binding domain-containing protein [Burkholderia gladioli]PRG56339.1 type VI secretion protein [Burkholderia gladioli]